ncbi:MAG: hypothetical protein FWB91_03395 [Defluviitaleaceae bacterium]|nr:hypothetical protein [Defluviitaleaceae bacterium]
MKITRKRTMAVAAILTLVMVLTYIIPVAAIPHGGPIPGSFWPVFNPYNAALDRDDSAAVVRYGRRLFDHMLSGQTAEARAAEWEANPAGFGFSINITYMAAYNVAHHALRINDGENAIWGTEMALLFMNAYQAFIPQIGGNPADLEFTRTILTGRLASLTVQAVLFAELRDGTGRIAEFDAPFVPRTGIFFGEPTGNSAVKGGPNPPSAVSIYVEFETQDMRQRVTYDLRRNETMFGVSRYDYSLVQINWNFLHEGSTPATIPAQGARITEAARFLNKTGLPILLRVGGEVDAWSNRADPDEFIAAFRFIANIMRREAPNVAMVYSVNHFPHHDIDWMTYYPGEDYVDWIGISLYVARYFLGNPNTTPVEAAIFRTGEYANPVAVMRELVEMFGHRHPIYISEGGVSLYNISNSEDLTEWALPRMRQLYAYIPMLFPEVKAIFWFNTYVPSDVVSMRFDFNTSSRARELYTQLVNTEYFLGRGQTESPITFAPASDGVTLPANAVALLTYAPFFAYDELVVQYFINGQWRGQSNIIPYRLVLDLSGLENGSHVLNVHILHNGSRLQSLEYLMVKYSGMIAISKL